MIFRADRRPLRLEHCAEAHGFGDVVRLLRGDGVRLTAQRVAFEFRADFGEFAGDVRAIDAVFDRELFRLRLVSFSGNGSFGEAIVRLLICG